MPHSNASEVLRKARDVITDPKHWTQGRLAIDAKGKEVPVNSPYAFCFCLSGAIIRVGGNIVGNSIVYVMLYKAVKEVGGRNLVTYNDTHTHTEVLALLDKAIEYADNQKETV